MKTFAVIIPTFNEEENIALLLEDIQKQSLRPNQIIIADAKSTDATREIAKRLGVEMVDGGLPGPGRNAGAGIATTDILFFMDADVRLFEKDFFEKAVLEFVDGGWGAAAVELRPMSTRIDDRIGHWVYNRLLHLQAKRHPLAAGSCMIATRDTHERIHGFDEDVTLGEDTEYAMRAARVAPFGVLRTVQIPVSVRRLDRDGRWGTLFTYLLAGIHVAWRGPVKHHRIKYEFGYDHMKKKSSTEPTSKK